MSSEKDAAEAASFAKPQGLPLENNLVYKVGPDDVLFGRGTPVTDNEGNIRLRRIIGQRQAEYSNAKKQKDKQRVALEIVHQITANGGRFLRKTTIAGQPLIEKKSAAAVGKGKVSAVDGSSDSEEPSCWIVVSDEKELTAKVKQLLRDMGPEAMSRRIERRLYRYRKLGKPSDDSQHSTSNLDGGKNPTQPARVPWEVNLSAMSTGLGSGTWRDEAERANRSVPPAVVYKTAGAAVPTVTTFTGPWQGQSGWPLLGTLQSGHNLLSQPQALPWAHQASLLHAEPGSGWGAGLFHNLATPPSVLSSPQLALHLAQQNPYLCMTGASLLSSNPSIALSPTVPLNSSHSVQSQTLLDGETATRENTATTTAALSTTTQSEQEIPSSRPTSRATAIPSGIEEKDASDPNQIG